MGVGGSRAPPVTLGRGGARLGTTGTAVPGDSRGVPSACDPQAPFPSAARDPGNQAAASVVREAVPACPPASPGPRAYPFSCLLVTAWAYDRPDPECHSEFELLI